PPLAALVRVPNDQRSCQTPARPLGFAPVMGQPGGPIEALNDAAALLVRLEPDDTAGLVRLADMLQAIGSAPLLPGHVQEPVGRALWRLLDLVEGQVEDAAGALAEIGQHLDEALDGLDDAIAREPG